MKCHLSTSALIVLALIFTGNCAAAFKYKYVGDRSAGYDNKINGGKGCFMGDCSKRKERLNARRPAISCSSRADSCRRKNSLNPNMASRCEPARLACLKTGTFVTLSGEKRTVDLKE
ncbi:hypothetical protein [Bradyrhizobium sp. USDA 4486]